MRGRVEVPLPGGHSLSAAGRGCPGFRPDPAGATLLEVGPLLMCTQYRIYIYTHIYVYVDYISFSSCMRMRIYICIYIYT